MYKKILIPTDGSKNADNEIPKALKLLDDEGELLIVSVAQKIKSHHFQSKDDVKRLNDIFVDEAQYNVDSMKEKLPSNINVTTKVLASNSPSKAISNLADEDGVELIVISRSNKTRISKFILGSVAEKLLKDADVDVLLISD